MTEVFRPTQSSQIEQCAYDSETRRLATQFKPKGSQKVGGVYLYHDVPPEVWEELKKSPSAGSFFSAAIKSKFEYELVDPTKQDAETIPAVPEGTADPTCPLEVDVDIPGAG